MRLIKKLISLDRRAFFFGLPTRFLFDLASTLRPTFLISVFCETIAVAFLSSHFERAQAYFFETFRLKRNSYRMAAKSISIVSRAIGGTFNKFLFVDVNIMRKVIWERARLHKIVVFIKTRNDKFFFLSNHNL